MYSIGIFVSNPVGGFLRARGRGVGMSLRAMLAWRARSSVTELRLPRGVGVVGRRCVSVCVCVHAGRELY